MLTNTAKNWDFFSFSEMDRKSDDARRKLRVIPREMLLVYGLRTPIKAFFPLKYPKFLGLGRQIGEMNFGTFGVFSAELKVS